MRRGALWLVALLYLLAWFLPAVKDQETLADGNLPGWEAMRLALSPLWSGEFRGNAWEWCLSVGSGLSNFVFVAAFVRLSRATPPATRAWSWILLAAAAVDSFWWWESGAPPDLRAGYYLWLASFVLLGLAARDLSPAGPRAAA